MFKIKLKAPVQRNRLRQWSPTAMTSAYNMVKDGNISVYKAAKRHGIPESTLRDRISNRISIDVTKSGPDPTFSLEEEAKLCAHLQELASVGYGYTRAEVVVLASDYAVSLGKRALDNPFSFKWFYGYMGRWPELKVVKPSSLSEQRARCASADAITNYCNELQRIVTKYDLMEKPQNIYNIDEKGINTEFRPPSVVAGINCKAQAIMAERSKNVTIIGAGNALGHQIPPYFVFPGVRMQDGLLEGKTPGADGVVTPTGWSNTEVFKTYLQTHFIKYCQGRNKEDTILILYDGHRSHVSINLVEWAKDNNIVLFVLPPHCSHILQPMDIGCFGPLQVKYAQECTKFSRLHHRVVTRYDVCGLACKAYGAALSPVNLQSAFAKSGIFPFQNADIMLKMLDMQIKPSTLYTSVSEENKENDSPGSDANECGDGEPVEQKQENQEVDFFENKRGSVIKKITKKKRRNVSTVIGGRALEGETEEKLKTYLADSDKKKRKTDSKSNKKSKSCTENKLVSRSKRTCKSGTKSNPPNYPRAGPSGITLLSDSPQPGPSCVDMIEELNAYGSESETESQIPADEKCCRCKRFYVLRDDHYVCDIVNWVACEACTHWVHLKYCTPLRVARKETKFVCDCCTELK